MRRTRSKNDVEDATLFRTITEMLMRVDGVQTREEIVTLSDTPTPLVLEYIAPVATRGNELIPEKFMFTNRSTLSVLDIVSVVVYVAGSDDIVGVRRLVMLKSYAVFAVAVGSVKLNVVSVIDDDVPGEVGIVRL